VTGTTRPRPAFYALAPGGWRDYVTLLHPPYTLWHLSYVAIGAGLAPHFKAGVLGLALLAFFLGMGVGAHALDELHGRPLKTRIGNRMLVALATTSLAGAAAIGIVVALRTSLWLLAFVVVGTFIAVAYNLELFGGRVHGDPWFSLAWGAFPVLATYCAEAPVNARAPDSPPRASGDGQHRAGRRLDDSHHARDLHRRVGAGAASALHGHRLYCTRPRPAPRNLTPWDSSLSCRSCSPFQPAWQR
jgi:hypothetical protein